MILNCYIIDDEPLAIRLLESYVDKTPFLRLQGSCTNAVTALADLSERPVDLLFLDIQMPELNGLEFSKIIGDRCRIIFTTAFEQYAVDSYKVNAIDYLLKPFAYTDFLKAAQKALQWFELSSGTGEMHSPDKSYIFVKSDYKLKQIPLDKVLYIEGLKDYVKIYLEDEPHPILSLLSLKSLEEMLPASFCRVHRSFIVNLNRITVIERNRIVFGKTYIPIADSSKDKFMEFLNKRTIK